MRRLTCGLLTLAVLGVGCEIPLDQQPEFGPPPGRVELRQAPATQPITKEPEPVPAKAQHVVVRLQGRPVLILGGATGRFDDTPVNYSFFVESAITQPAATAAAPEVVRENYLLKPSSSIAPPIHCEITYGEHAEKATITLSAKGDLPDIKLLGTTPAVMLPIRILRSDDEPDPASGVIQTAMGPVADGLINALFDPEDDFALGIDGLVDYQLARDGVVLVTSLPGPRGHRHTVLTLTAHKDFLRSTRAGRDDAPYDRSVYDKILHDYWFRGWAWHADPGPISVGAPLTLARARLSVSLMGLNGLALTTKQRLDQLPAERAELLRRIRPPAPIRAVDLFTRLGTAQPDVWDLKIATDFDRWDVLGVFNWSAQSTNKSVQLSQLGLGAEGEAPFAVYDFWRRRLLAVTKDRCDAHLPPTSCRVLCIRRLREGQPTLVSTSGHITQGGIDLHEVRFDPETLTMSGKSDVAADDPYELRLFTGEGDDHFEITGVETDAHATGVRADGPVQIVTLESSDTRPVAWKLTFARAPRMFYPPAPPVNPSAKQNTRGVRLSWNAGDDRAVVYRIYRDQQRIAEVSSRQYEFQDSGVIYDTWYTYTVTAADWARRESQPSSPVTHRTPIPADAHLTQLVPLSGSRDRPALGVNKSVEGNPLRIAGHRYAHGLGTRAGARIVYFIGGGYETFSGQIGIDDETEGKGSAGFEIYADDELLFKSNIMRGGQAPQSFTVPIKDRRRLTLKVTDGGDGADGDHADWGDTYLKATPRPAPAPVPAPATQPATRPGAQAGQRVIIDTSLGAIVIELDTERTPTTVQNFLQYVDDKFYDGMIFHRVIDGFVIQAGGYTADLTAKPTREPIENEAPHGPSNTRGAVAMARGEDPNSATSQFYLNLRDNQRLDTYGGGYCVFGKVVQGMDVVERIAAVPTEDRGDPFQNLPVETVLIRSIRRQ